ncbi:TPA: tyrosine-type recombinase/integrase [Vibrio parahaemolyticus]|nr:integrase family protein [Vibrio parahaemolyticus]EKZ9248956.1 integrase family protein [Vibrio parahaemolyticus]ELA6677401.1 integrase family protein [Vibrio parahaemolyticus]ELI6470712.1 integrase family protein [Vibrio parahaemolyticus]
MKEKVNLSKKLIENLQPEEKRYKVKDAKISGLFVEVMPSGARIYRLRSNKSKIGREITVTIGRYPEIMPDMAREIALTHLVEIAKGNNPNQKTKAERQKKASLWIVFEDYVSNNAKLKDITRKRYGEALKRDLGDWCDKPIENISREMICERHNKITQKSPANADGTFRILRALFNFAREEYRGQESEFLFDENPVYILNHRKKWNHVKRKTSHIKQSDLPKWWEAIYSEWESARTTNPGIYRSSVACSLLVALLTGLRKEEILSLEWKRVDFTNNTITIESTKNGDVLELPIPPKLKQILLLQKNHTKGKYVFPSPGHGRVSEPKKVIKYMETLSGVSAGYHDLRRTFITIAETCAVGSYTLKRLLNHRTARSDVTEGYLILTAEQLRDASELVEKKILQIARVE